MDEGEAEIGERAVLEVLLVAREHGEHRTGRRPREHEPRAVEQPHRCREREQQGGDPERRREVAPLAQHRDACQPVAGR